MMVSRALRSSTLVSPVTRLAPHSPSAASIDATIRSRSATSNPSGMTMPHESAIGRPPIIARSLIVPQTAIRPMSPPGKKIGETTWLSVVKTMFWPFRGMTAPSSSDSSPIPPALLCSRLVMTRRSSPITSPPAPCMRLTFILRPLLSRCLLLRSPFLQRSPGVSRTEGR